MFPRVLQIARAVSQRYAAGDKNIGIDVRDVMLQVMVRWGNGDDFQQVLNLYRHACYNQEDRRAALSALGYVSSPEYVKQVLDLVLSDEVEDGDVSQQGPQLHSFLYLPYLAACRASSSDKV